MYTEKNGRVWSSEENFLLYRKLSYKNFRSFLALENYDDLEKNPIPYDKSVSNKYCELTHQKDKMTEEELIKEYSLIAKKFDEILDKIGREKFIFYDDGDVEFIWENKGE